MGKIMNSPAKSSGVSMHDTIDFNVSNEGVLDSNFAIKKYMKKSFGILAKESLEPNKTTLDKIKKGLYI